MDIAHTRNEGFHLSAGHTNWMDRPSNPFDALSLVQGDPLLPFCRSIFRLNNFPLSHPHTHFFNYETWWDFLIYSSTFGDASRSPGNSLYLGLNSTIFRGGFEWQAFLVHRTNKHKKTSKKRFLSEMKIILSEMRAWKTARRYFIPSGTFFTPRDWKT